MLSAPPSRRAEQEGELSRMELIPRSVQKLPAAAFAAASRGKLPAPPPLLTFTEHILNHFYAERAPGIVSETTVWRVCVCSSDCIGKQRGYSQTQDNSDGALPSSNHTLTHLKASHGQARTHRLQYVKSVSERRRLWFGLLHTEPSKRIQ